jgi:hypothetical protein
MPDQSSLGIYLPRSGPCIVVHSEEGLFLLYRCLSAAHGQCVVEEQGLHQG